MAPHPTITSLAFKALHGADYAVIPDSAYEAGTLLLAAAITRSELTVWPDREPNHLSAVNHKLEDAGCSFTDSASRPFTIHPGGTCVPVDILHPTLFPGFPTDRRRLLLQACWPRSLATSMW